MEIKTFTTLKKKFWKLRSNNKVFLTRRQYDSFCSVAFFQTVSLAAWQFFHCFLILTSLNVKRRFFFEGKQKRIFLCFESECWNPISSAISFKEPVCNLVKVMSKKCRHSIFYSVDVSGPFTAEASKSFQLTGSHFDATKRLSRLEQN